MFVAGAVTIGVEYRFLDEAAILEFYGPDARAQFDNVAPAGMGGVVQEDGLCLHVFGADDGLERLRFDCFDDAPHYHYLDPHAPRNVVVDYDAVANGPMLDWALHTALDARLAVMLRHAGAAHLAARVDPSEIARVLPAVAEEARRALVDAELAESRRGAERPTREEIFARIAARPKSQLLPSPAAAVRAIRDTS
jgi:hypothetical protein